MRISLSHVILHQVKINAEGEHCVHFRKELLPNSVAAEEFITDLHLIYNNKQGKGFGQFAKQSDFAERLAASRKNQMDFLTFSSQTAEQLKEKLDQYPFIDADILVMAEYRALTTDYLLIGLLASRPSMKVTDTLELSTTEYLDIAKMDIVAQIDLSTLESNAESNRYLTYFKGRVGRKVADFFLDFMQAEVGLDAKKQNEVLLDAVNDYYISSGFEKEERQQCQELLHEYCKSQAKAGEELHLKELADSLPQTESGNFYQFIEKEGYELEEHFPVDKNAVRKLTRFIGNGGGLSVHFDNLLLGERVFYDAESDSLTIKGTPPNLRDQLKRYLELDSN